MKNMKVAQKLIVSFLIVTILTVAVGVVGITSLSVVDTDYTYAIEMHGKPLEDAGHMIADLHAVRAELRAAMLFSGDAAKVENQRTLVNEFLADFEARGAVYTESIISTDSRELFDAAMDAYNNDFKPAVEKTLSDAENGVAASELVAYMVSTIKPAVDLATNNLEQCMINKSNNLETTSAESTAVFHSRLVILIVLVVAAAAISMAFALYISRLISRPLSDMSGYIRQAGETGNLSFKDEEWANCDRLSEGKDEIAQTMKAFAKMLRKFVYYGETVGRVADNDLTVEVETLGENDTFGNAIVKMLGNLNDMFKNINMSSEQVSTGAGQVANGAQALASGSTEQAASIQELSSSISEIAGRTKANAEMASQAAKLAGTIKDSAEKGSRQMDEMMTAVKEISQSSNEIGRVIKVIDDIAFQTNILALNAAVEAARAGQHGKGFAVVAEEVRNLAAKSAEAAKDTESLIANSMEKAGMGVRIAEETSTSLSEIVTGINESTQLVTEIAGSSEEQSLGISQINTGIDQVATVVQQNSATAEQSAAASEEMSGQSAMLQQLIAQFKLKDDAASGRLSFGDFDSPKHYSAPERAEHSGFSDGGSKYDKY